MTEEELYNTDRDDLCDCLRWKSLYVNVAPDPSVPSGRSHHFWCVFTQTVLGPDGEVALPATCGPDRACYGTGRIR